MGNETAGILSDGVCWKPGQLPFQNTKQFPENFKWRLFGVASKLRVKPKMEREIDWGNAGIYLL